ncbi:mRNA interferase YafQ [Rhodobium orientis]|uniref:Type II toxin-antitoxin system mRNA interferase toxin, RelE/StbE family n=1 Tax=Rhodobium orientis TaxID=34017 RepID=A0A327JJP0_9HYPH|nr:type II toxin-antitoxin system YafQ family toxin [Rhodobium orientis]MBB4302835.1 mRNA interferase YafQ [Rhodobium orientis]RAI26261.1 hypothetical protein CH339_14845 [Rhodobium orientis]
MRQSVFTNKFRKDYKLCAKRGWRLGRLQNAIRLIENDADVPDALRPHKLAGAYSGYWECHIAPDWLLIYWLDDEANTVVFERTGSHADLFG